MCFMSLSETWAYRYFIQKYREFSFRIHFCQPRVADFSFGGLLIERDTPIKQGFET